MERWIIEVIDWSLIGAGWLGVLLGLGLTLRWMVRYDEFYGAGDVLLLPLRVVALACTRPLHAIPFCVGVLCLVLARFF